MNITQQLQQINKLKQDLFLFHNYLFKDKVKNKYTFPSHLKEVSDLLTQHVGPEPTNTKHLMLNMPPRVGKSSILLVTLPLWLIMNDNDLHVAGVTYSDDLAKRIGLELKQAFERHHDLLGLSINPAKTSVSDFKFINNSTGEPCNGSLRIMSKSSSITGSTFSRVIIDDIFNPTQLVNNTRTESEIFEDLWKWYDVVLRDRIDVDTKMVLSHTRYGDEDLIGRILRDEVEYSKYDHYNYPAIRPDGTHIYPEKYTKEFFLQKQRESNTLFHTRYQGEPLDEIDSGFFKNNFYNFSKEVPNQLFCSVDLAWTERRKSKYTAMVIGGAVEDRLIITNVGLVKTKNPLLWLKNMNNRFRDTSDSSLQKPRFMFEEQPSSGLEVVRIWTDDLLLNNFQEPLWCKPSKNKELRATLFRDMVNSDKVWFHDSLEGSKEHAGYVKQVKAFPESVFMDYVDASSQIVNNIFNIQEASFGYLFDGQYV